MKRLWFAALLVAAVFALPTQADFIQCTAAFCTATDNDDLVNGTLDDNGIDGQGGNDIIFGGPGRDDIDGELDNDVIFGGPGSDTLAGGATGNDIFVPGPDDAVDAQESNGQGGNDSFIVLAGETVNCQGIEGGEGFDVLHLIGFGPYTAEFPYGLATPIEVDSNIIIQDPIAGGFIFVLITDQGPDNVERINGLPTPNVTVLDTAETQNFIDQNCNFIT